MKKNFLSAVLMLMLIFSCQTPESSEESQASYENLFVLNFQKGHLPDSVYSGCLDTEIESNQPDTNFGNAQGFNIGYGGGSTFRALIKFDLDGYLPANAVIKRAILTLHIQSFASSSSDPDFTIQAHKMSAAFSETVDTWNTMNSQYESTVIGSSALTGTEQTIAMDISASVVGDWLKNPSDNFGIMIRRATEGSVLNIVAFYSSNTPTISWRPMLTIVYAL